MNFSPDIHLWFSCNIFSGCLRLYLMTRWNITLDSMVLFLQSTKHKHSITFYCFLSLISLLILVFSQRLLLFSHTLTTSFLPCIRLLLFNSGGPDVHLITALPWTRTENSLRLFSPAAMASGAKYTPTDTNKDNHCCDSLLSSRPARCAACYVHSLHSDSLFTFIELSHLLFLSCVSPKVFVLCILFTVHGSTL